MSNYSKLKSEFRKFVKQNLGTWGFLILIVLMVYFAITTHNIKTAFQSGFGSTQWVTIIMMMVAGSFMDMEYTNGTILSLIYKQDHKLTIYINKLLVVSVYSILLVSFSLILTFTLGYLIGLPFSVNQINDLLINFFGTLIYSFFMVSLSLLLLSIFKSNIVVVGIGLFLGFLGTTISGFITQLLPYFHNILKWNPLNMIYIISQINNPKFKDISGLSSSDLIIGNIIYSLIFIYLGYILFKNRRI